MKRKFETTRIQLLATMGGYLWMPATPAMKGIRAEVTRQGLPLTTEWTGDFRSLLEGIDTREGGDFQNCRFLDACLIITRTAPGGMVKGRTERIRLVDPNLTAPCDYLRPQDKPEDV